MIPINGSLGSGVWADCWERRPSFRHKSGFRGKYSAASILSLQLRRLKRMCLSVEDNFKRIISIVASQLKILLTPIQVNMFRIVEREVPTNCASAKKRALEKRDTHKYFNTSANQKLWVSSNLPPLGLFTSFNPTKPPLDRASHLLNWATADEARSKYLVSPVTLYA